MHATKKQMRLFAGACVVLAGVFLFFLSSWESAKSRDAIRLQQLAGVQSALHLYATEHVTYPHSPSAGLYTGSPDACLTDGGFVRLSDESCKKTRYPLFTGNFLYESFDDAQSYRITFTLDTGIAGVPKGTHTVGPDGGIN